MKDLTGQAVGTAITPTEWNHERLEVQNVVTDTGQALSDLDPDQQGKAIAAYAGGADFYTMSNTVTVIVLTSIGTMQGPPAYRDGLQIRFRPTGTSTTAATVNINGLGAVDLERADGSAITAGIFSAAADVVARFNSASGDFLLVEEITVLRNRNWMDNPEFVVGQHDADGNYSHGRDVTTLCAIPGGGNDDYDIPIDRWHLISEVNNAVNIEQRTGVIDDGMAGAIELTVVTTGSKFGLLQNIEHAVCRASLNGTQPVSLSFEVQPVHGGGGTIGEIRSAIISWQGTVNAMPATPVSVWNADAAAVTFGAATNTVEDQTDHGTPSIGSFTRFTVDNIDVATASSKNLRIAIWANDASAMNVGDSLIITRVKVEAAVAATGFETKSYYEDFGACRRHYQHLGHQESDGFADADKVACGWGADVPTSDFAFHVPLLGAFCGSLDAATVAFSTLANFKSGGYESGDGAVMNIRALVSMNEVTQHRHGYGSLSIEAPGAGVSAARHAVLLVGDVADGDGFFDAGIHVRSLM